MSGPKKIHLQPGESCLDLAVGMADSNEDIAYLLFTLLAESQDPEHRLLAAYIVDDVLSGEYASDERIRQQAADLEADRDPIVSEVVQELGRFSVSGHRNVA